MQLSPQEIMSVPERKYLSFKKADRVWQLTSHLIFNKSHLQDVLSSVWFRYEAQEYF